MGLDLTLGILVLISALRGWGRGFVLQVVRIAGVVAGVYAAEPVRDSVRPYIDKHLPTMDPGLLDKLLWWAAALVSYMVLVGMATLLVKLYRRSPVGDSEPNRGDQFVGLLFGAAKGVVVASVLTLVIDTYATEYTKNLPWAEEQVRASQALLMNREYAPAVRLWESQPVQNFVGYIKSRGLSESLGAPGTKEKKETPLATDSNGEPEEGTPAKAATAPKDSEFETTLKSLRKTLRF